MTHAEYNTMDRVWPSEKLEQQMVLDAKWANDDEVGNAPISDCACHITALLVRVRQLEEAVNYLDRELETTADKLSTCWLFLDQSLANRNNSPSPYYLKAADDRKPSR